MPADSLALNYWKVFSGPPDEVHATLGAMLGKQEEDEHLDFKEWSPNEQANEPQLCRTLCAFANTGGGVLVFGVETREVSKVDTAHALKPIDDAEKRATWLRDRARFISDPPLTGVQIVAICPSALNGKGFIVCYAPEGRNKPYRAEKANRRWLMRHRSHTDDIPPSHLRSLFFPSRISRATLRILRHRTPDDRIPKETTLLPFILRVRLDSPFVADNCGLDFVPDSGTVIWWKPAQSGGSFIEEIREPLPQHLDRLYPKRFSSSLLLAVKLEGATTFPSIRIILYLADALPLGITIRTPGFLYEETGIELAEVSDTEITVYDAKHQKRWTEPVR
jgi:hypothetical protein